MSKSTADLERHTNARSARRRGQESRPPLGLMLAAVIAAALIVGAVAPSASAHTGNHGSGVPSRVPHNGPSWSPDEVYVYGHSFAMGPDSLTGPYPYSGYSYGSLIGDHYGVPKDYNGRSGTRLMDTVRAVTAPTLDGSAARLWPVGNGHGSSIVTLQNGHGDEASQLGGDAVYQDGYRLALNLTLGAFGAGSKTLAGKASYTQPGAWKSVAYADRAPGGAMSYTKTYGAKMAFAVRSDSVTIATVASDPSLTYATMRIEVDGKTVGYYNGTGRSEAYPDIDGAVRSWSLAGIHITGLGAGSHTITLRKVSKDSTSPIFVSAVYEQSSTPPHVLLGMEPERNPAATSQGEVANFDANDPTFRAIWTAACADYSYVHCVDLNAASTSAPVWDNATMVATNGPACPGVDCGKIADRFNFHPNGVGMMNIATKFEDAINAS